MWQALEQKIVQINNVTGLEVIFLPDNKYLINGITISSNKNKISRQQEITGISTISELTQKLDPKIPLSIVINGKGILVKKLPVGQSFENAIIAVLPNANPTDFFYEAQQYNDLSIITITRKEVVEKFLNLLKEAGFSVLQVSLGFNTISNVLPFLYADNQASIITSSFALHTDAQKKITDYEAKETIDNDTFRMAEYAIGDQYVRSSHLLAFAAALHLMTDVLKNAPIVSSPSLIHERAEFRYSKLFRFAGMCILGVMFFVLLINFMIYNHYFNKNKELQVTQVFSKEKQQQTALQLENIQRKERFLNRSGWDEPCKASFYADRIASLTPFNTMLTSMAIYPLKSNLSGEFPVMNFKTDTIQVTGTCDNPVEINQFMNNLKIITAFKTVALKNYLYKKEQETATFSLEIITR
jgi:hypothetical protein